jgi:hypothetical protein
MTSGQVNRICMKQGLLLAALVGALLAPAITSAAERHGGRPQAQSQGQPVKKAQNPPPQRDKGHDKQRSNKLTDDERRQLRQDVDRADREIYRR